MESSKMFVSYAQIAFFDGTLPKPFNNWTEQHVKQGFAWRQGSVSFKTLIASGEMNVEFVCVTHFSPAINSMRTISVPFSCRHEAKIEIATITDSKSVKLDFGHYQLVFETGQLDNKYWCRFTAVRHGTLDPMILVRDSEIDPVFPLIMEAVPAD